MEREMRRQVNAGTRQKLQTSSTTPGLYLRDISQPMMMMMMSLRSLHTLLPAEVSAVFRDDLANFTVRKTLSNCS